MLIDQYIAELTKLRNAHGPDLEVMRVSTVGYVTKAGLPRLAHMRNDKPRTQLFSPENDLDRFKGAKVVRV